MGVKQHPEYRKKMLWIIQTTGHTQVLGMDPDILKELTGSMSRLYNLRSFKGHGDQRTFQMIGRRQDSTPIIKKRKKVMKKDPDNYRTVSFSSVSVKVMKQNLLKVICKHMKDKVMESRVYQGQITPDLLLCFLERGD